MGCTNGRAVSAVQECAKLPGVKAIIFKSPCIALTKSESKPGADIYVDGNRIGEIGSAEVALLHFLGNIVNIINQIMKMVLIWI